MQKSDSAAAQYDNNAFLEQVSAQVRRVTAELLKLEQMLKAGMVDYAVLVEFRKTVDQIRQTSWTVEQSLIKASQPTEG
jgi:hypothetical protein